jgi:hypothetical protein
MPFFASAGRTSAWALTIAALWSVLLIAVGGFAPLASHSSMGAHADSATGQSVQDAEVTTTSSLVTDNGIWVLAVLAIPLVVTLLVGLCLTQGWWWAGWVLSGLFVAFTFLAMLSIGVFLLPVTIGLVVASTASRRQPERSWTESVAG